MTLLLISLFGALGCVVRYLLEYAVRRHHPTNRPWATVAANAVGRGIAGYTAYRSWARRMLICTTSFSRDSVGD